MSHFITVKDADGKVLCSFFVEHGISGEELVKGVDEMLSRLGTEVKS